MMLSNFQTFQEVVRWSLINQTSCDHSLEGTATILNSYENMILSTVTNMHPFAFILLSVSKFLKIQVIRILFTEENYASNSIG